MNYVNKEKIYISSYRNKYQSDIWLLPLLQLRKGSSDVYELMGFVMGFIMASFRNKVLADRKQFISSKTVTLNNSTDPH